MAGEYWLSDEAWAVIDPLIPKVYPGTAQRGPPDHQPQGKQRADGLLAGHEFL